MALASRQKWPPLHEAAASGDVDKVRQLLEEGNDASYVDWIGWTPLHRAAAGGHLGVVRLLISEFKADVNVRSDSGETPLHTAASGGHLGVVRVLISEFKADVNVHSNSGETPLHIAASGFKADVNASTNQGSTPFDVAVRSQQEEVALALINEFHCDTKGGTPYIHTACKRGWVNLVQALIQEHGTGILKGPVNRVGSTLFDVAINREEVALTLIDHCDTKGGTPYIHTACKRGWVNLVQALVRKHGTGILKAVNDEGNTPLHTAVISGKEDVIFALINKLGCDVSIKGYKGRSPLHIACEEGNASLVQTLILHHKADVTARDDEDNTPLHVAVMSDREDVVVLLINEFSCDVSVTGHLGRSLLHLACASEKSIGLQLVRYVYQHIFPWVVDDNGDTPLHICARLGQTYRAKDLLELDPPVMIRNNSVRTNTKGCRKNIQ